MKSYLHYAISETLAIGACRAIFDSGNKVPEDYSVAGSDGLDIAEYYRPSITTVFKYREKIAKESIKTLSVDGKKWRGYA